MPMLGLNPGSGISNHWDRVTNAFQRSTVHSTYLEPKKLLVNSNYVVPDMCQEMGSILGLGGVGTDMTCAVGVLSFRNLLAFTIEKAQFFLNYYSILFFLTRLPSCPL